jgi:hypothetical protein
MKRSPMLVLATLVAATGAASAVPSYDKWEIISMSPVNGKPWVGSSSAFDWSNWSFSDSILKNNASGTRTWVVPLPTVVQFSSYQDDQYGVWSMTTHIDFAARVRAGTNGDTCLQAVLNVPSGSRYAVSGVSCTSSTSSTWLTTDYIGSDIGMTAYLNFNVGGGGGRVSYTEARAWMFTQ